MFTVKVLHDNGIRHGYEAQQYTVEDDEKTLSFTAPRYGTQTDASVISVHLRPSIERIVVENASGKTVENLTHPPA